MFFLENLRKGKRGKVVKKKMKRDKVWFYWG